MFVVRSCVLGLLIIAFEERNPQENWLSGCHSSTEPAAPLSQTADLSRLPDS